MSTTTPRKIPEIVVPPPGPKSRTLLERFARVGYPGLSEELAPFVMARKRGYAIEDVDGNVYLDMISAMASVPLGSCREDLMEPAIEALRRFGNEDSHFYPHEPMVRLAEKLVEITPSSLSRVDIALSGTEAVETAIKFMRRATGRPIVISFLGQYHGESTTTATLGAERSDFSQGMRQLVGGLVHVPYPSPYRTPFGPPRPGGSGDATIDYLRDHVLFHQVHPGEVAGVFIEPIIGTGGVLIPPDGFWRALVELCREHDWLLGVDEVKSGFGRTGTMWAVDRWGVEPDLMCMGKAIGGGVLPLGAVLGSERAMGTFDDVPTGSTWSWLPAACVAALETIRVFQTEDVLGNVRALDEEGHRLLGALMNRFEVIGDVRVAGGYQAVEFVKDRATKERASAFQEAVAREALRRGMIADSSTTSYNLQPSLLMPVEAYRDAIGILEASIAAVLESGIRS